jgi:hypothetical protein
VVPLFLGKKIAGFSQKNLIQKSKFNKRHPPPTNIITLSRFLGLIKGKDSKNLKENKIKKNTQKEINAFKILECSPTVLFSLPI